MAFALSIACFRETLYSGSPPFLAATVIALASFVNVAALFASCFSFLPAMVQCLPTLLPPL